jgi:hypothetical protein
VLRSAEGARWTHAADLPRRSRSRWGVPRQAVRTPYLKAGLLTPSSDPARPARCASEVLLSWAGATDVPRRRAPRLLAASAVEEACH